MNYEPQHLRDDGRFRVSIICGVVPKGVMFIGNKRIAQFAITINSNVCPHIRVPNMLMRESFARRHRNF